MVTRIHRTLFYAMLVALVLSTASCGKKKKGFFFFPGLAGSTPAEAETVDLNPVDTGSSPMGDGGLEMTYPGSFTEQPDPEGAYSGSLLEGEDGDTYGSGSIVPPAESVDSLMDRLLAALAGWDAVDENGYSLISRQDVGNAPVPTETASVQIRVTDPATADAVRNALVQLIGSVDGSGDVSQFPASGGTTSTTVFRIVLQASQDNEGHAAVLFGVTTDENYANVESDLAGLVDGTNIGPSGSESTAITDELLAASPPRADFLFVVDNSGSMSEEQNAVKQNALGFFDRLSGLGLDFRIATITTDSSKIRNTGFTSSRTQFESDIAAGTNGDGKESCTYYAEKALASAATNAQNAVLTNGGGPLGTVAAALRTDVPLTVICVTDESDAYTKWDGSGSNSDAARFDINSNIFLSGAYTYYAIMPLDNSGQHGSCSGVNGSASVTSNFSSGTLSVAALRMDQLAARTGGSVSSICGENYGAFLNQLADRTAAGASSYQLSRTPISATLKVYVNGVAIEATSNPASGQTGYVYLPSVNRIAFTGSLPALGTPVSIAYKSYGL
ncbi:MAG: VWA domain-containing protein [Leptonema illini]|uniref:VWA domain-containing protein n=1 Tax=Leptonema illini TaxID=183 RepID=A0A833H3J1_9LEPT|nr:MAG: VWA domain-containing protein [Leptonema illini]